MIPIQFEDKDKNLDLLIGERKLSIYKGDILALEADALVCPVNQSLDLKSGLAKIVTEAAGKQIKNQKPAFPEPYGKVVVLPGGRLKAKYVFLTVVMGEKGVEKMKLSIQQAVERSIRYAEFLRLKSVAFPVMGSPVFAPSYNFVAHEMMKNVIGYFQRRNTKLKAVLFSAFNDTAFNAFRQEAKDISTL